MASTNDITQVIGDYVKAYIKPKWPIYRISYCLSSCCWDDQTLQTKYYSYLVECKPAELRPRAVSLRDNLLYKTSNPSINKEFVAQWNQRVKDGRPFFKIEGLVGRLLACGGIPDLTDVRGPGGAEEWEYDVMIVGLERIA